MSSCAEALAINTSLINQFESCITNYKKANSDRKKSIPFLQTRISTLTDIFKQIQENDVNINSFKTDETVAYNNSESFLNIDDKFHNFVADLMEAIDKLKPKNNNNSNTGPSNLVANPNPPAQMNQDFRLPTINIPNFNGEYNAWPSFKNSFELLVANNATLTNLQRLHHLKNSVSGEAQRLIQHYDLIENNYQAAWEKLTIRFNNKRVLVSNHLKSLLNMPAANKESVHHIRQLIDTTTDCINGLKGLEIQTDNWDPIVIHILTDKMASSTHSQWETTLTTNNELPQLSELIQFLENRFRSLEAIACKTPSTHPVSELKSIRKPQNSNSFLTNSSIKCNMCDESHYLRHCQSFLSLNIPDRIKFVQLRKLCTNCLVQGHSNSQCRNKANCFKCKKRHNTLLHLEQNPTTVASNNQLPKPSSENSPPVASTSNSMHQSNLAIPNSNTILLSTALINVKNSHGNLVALRALIDSGSQVSFITSRAAKLLQLKSLPTNASVFGIGQTHSGTTTKYTSAFLSSTTNSDISILADLLIIPNITGSQPITPLKCKQWHHIQHLPLADPYFHQTNSIDILLGAEIYSQIIMPGIQRGNANEPVAQNTTLGWILFGGTQSRSQKTYNHISMHTCINIDQRLRSFWEYEEIFHPTRLNTEEQMCEQHFLENYKRDQHGRFTVRLPFKQNPPPTLGYSRHNALTRLYQMERKFVREPQLAVDYNAFMIEYESLGHMRPMPDKHDAYFIPHHAVIKSSSSTTKLRVVFDASRKSSSGLSLNESLMVGPTIQDELTSILTRWRKYPIAFSSDLEKMYRQIRIDDKDLDYQRILWRSSTEKPIQEYQLLTVTYGTACSQHLAIRALHQLAHDNVLKYPRASAQILNDFYVDDLLSGAYTLPEALESQQQLREILRSGGFNLRKWSSNNESLLHQIPEQDREIKTSRLIEFDNTIKSLGIHWSPSSDTFTFQSTLDQISAPITKRVVLSDTSKLFDPQGWLCPIIIRAKILIQRLWLIDLEWDDEVPPTQVKEWQEIRNTLKDVHEISIARFIGHNPQCATELHGFSDASIHAYAAVVYSRTTQLDGTFLVNILAAKSRVAPVKQITIAKLELAGAHLLSKLITKLKADLKVDIIKITAWTDSSIVLQWMQCHPNRLQTYVANRISDILNNSDIHQWRHVSGIENPADCASRGTDARKLKNHPLWWKGPSWLSQATNMWPSSKPTILSELPEVKATALIAQHRSDELTSFIESYSSMHRLKRITAYILRFLHNARKRTNHRNGALTASEIEEALHKLISHVQQTEFHTDYVNLKSNRHISSKSNLKSLNPFLEKDLLRVGGRLQHSELSFNEKHPIIMPKSHHLTKLLIDQTHIRTLHGGAQLVMTSLRQQYWIIHMRSIVRYQLHRCVKCFRYSAPRCSQLMGSLPKPRVNIDRVFTHTGVDCAGPISIRMSKGRGAKSYKGYITLFVCLSTKAIHIEAVSDMSTAAFIAAYRRFSARRGSPAHMYSDNGTNFIGAANILSKTVKLPHISKELIDELATSGTQWHFIPPSAPHFGGLWEAGIKSMKQHLKKIIGDHTLTFEEITTLLYQIEQCLNSRPLCPITSDPTDLNVLTPGHFLVGDSLLSPPSNPNEFDSLNVLTRWQHVQRMLHHFWKRWQHEYLARLQQRPKWQSQNQNIKKDDLVLVIEDNLPPSRWVLGRILETHQGSDNLVRVVTIKCKNTTLKRPITKIALLPN